MTSEKQAVIQELIKSKTVLTQEEFDELLNGENISTIGHISDDFEFPALGLRGRSETWGYKSQRST